MVPDPGPHRGPEGVRRFWDMWHEAFVDFRSEIVEVHDLDDHVVVIARDPRDRARQRRGGHDPRLPAGLDMERGPDRASGDVHQLGQRERGDRKGLAVRVILFAPAHGVAQAIIGTARLGRGRDGRRRHRAGHARARLDGAGRTRRAARLRSARLRLAGWQSAGRGSSTCASTSSTSAGCESASSTWRSSAVLPDPSYFKPARHPSMAARRRILSPRPSASANNVRLRRATFLGNPAQAALACP